MADPAASSSKAPWHLWVVGVVAVLWNATGAVDFVMTETRNAAYLSAMTPRQLEYINAFPVWVIVAWGLGVWGGVFGSLLLLFRKNLAGPVFLASIAGVILTNLHEFVLSNGREIFDGPGPIIFAAVIFVVAVLLWLYARAMRRRGVLR